MSAHMEGTDNMRARVKPDAASINFNGTSRGAPRHGALPVSPAERKDALLREREGLVVWRRPLTTLRYFLLELALVVREYGRSFARQTRLLSTLSALTLVLIALHHAPGPHQPHLAAARRQGLWCAYWVGLGVLSSVGLGTGLHTFVLYLGPHIAAVTLAAFECGSVDFPEPPYPDEIVCPPDSGAGGVAVMSLWTIMSKVRVEAFMWGAGTAIGELPPYFMARAARLSGLSDDADLHPLVSDSSGGGAMERAKVVVQRLVHRVGFWGILLCASIPNPLFDLAGITCGHFLVPFWTFFGATLIGKAIVKMHIQQLFVIFVFSEHHVEVLLRLLAALPRVGASLHAPLRDYLSEQKVKMHRLRAGGEGAGGEGGGSWVGWVLEKVVIAMVVYFVVSIVHSLAQNYHRRRSEGAGGGKRGDKD